MQTIDNKQNNGQNSQYPYSGWRKREQHHEMNNKELHEAVRSLSKEDLDGLLGRGSAPLCPGHLSLYAQKLRALTNDEFTAWYNRLIPRDDIASAPHYPADLC